MYKITIKKTVEESYVIDFTESGSVPTESDAMRMAALYAQMPEHEFRKHVSAVRSRVGLSQRVLGIKTINAQSLQ